MASKLFIGSLPYSTTDEELKEAFGAFGTVESAAVIMDRETGRSRGFGFVEMSTEEEAKAAIEGMNEKELGGRNITVSQARAMERRPGGGGGGGPRRF